MIFNAEKELLKRERDDAPSSPIRLRTGFSYKSWQYLEDIWPRPVRLRRDSRGEIYEAMKIVSVMLLPIRKAQRFAKSEGYVLRVEDLFMLFWIQRFEDAKENAGAKVYQTGLPLDYCKKLTLKKHTRLVVAGLIEHYPGHFSVVRVTARGKVMMSRIMDDIEQAHRDIHEFVNNQSPDILASCEAFLSRYSEAWKKMDLSNPPDL